MTRTQAGLSLKEKTKLLLFWVPNWILRPIVVILWRLGAINRHYYTYSKLDFPTAILQGPFAGMKYIPASAGSKIIPKYLGTYERELWPAVHRICSHPCDVLVDVGSAEGYYAVGLALRLKPNIVHCFDIELHAHRLLEKIAEKNHVIEKMRTYLGCTVAELERVLHDALAPVVIMDCEGGEDELLDPKGAPSLAKATILVELHESERPGIAMRIQERFGRTHRIENIKSVKRCLKDLPAQVKLCEMEATFALDEGRPGNMNWFMMLPMGRES